MIQKFVPQQNMVPTAEKKSLLIPLYDLSIKNHRITKKNVHTARAYKNAKQTNIIHQTLYKKKYALPVCCCVRANSNLPLIPEFCIFIASFPL